VVTDWQRFVAEHGPTIFAAAWRILAHSADVEDVVQEVFLDAYRLQQSQAVACWPALLRRMATCRALDRLRQRRHEIAVGRRKDCIKPEGKPALDMVTRFYMDFKADVPDSVFEPRDRER
jgi:DNA-directed RNA polymerase specialized sigma24 family protein